VADFQTLLNAVAQVVGGTAPNPATEPFWFSGSQVGDGTGVAGLKGCFSTPPGSIEDPPMAFVIGGPFRLTDEPRQGIKGYEDMDYSILDPFRDSVPAAFDSHMQLFSTPTVLDAVIVSGRPGFFAWGRFPFVGWEFGLRVRRLAPIVYSA
jgi:hypothetical protein